MRKGFMNHLIDKILYSQYKKASTLPKLFEDPIFINFAYIG